MMYGGWENGMGGGWWVLMIVFWLLVLAATVWALTRIFASGSAGGERERSERDTPEEELDRRLARGEIDAENYREIRATLRGADEEKLTVR